MTMRLIRMTNYIRFTVASLTLALAGWCTQAAAGADTTRIEKGRYLATVADCAACHTAKGGKPFAGGRGIASPVGTIYSTNITPDPRTGIGGYTLADFDRALRRGIAKDGTTLYPAMPYVSYSKVTPQDVQALYAYFMHAVAPVEQANKAEGIRWPLSMRWPLRFWRMAFAPRPVQASADDNMDGNANTSEPASDDPVLRGRYLVEGLAHCGTCHTPRGFALQEKALSDTTKTYLSGAVVDGYLAKNLRGDPKNGLGTWSADDIAAFLKRGRSDDAAAFGGMAEVVAHSTQYMSDADLAAIAAYLKSLSPLDPNGDALMADDTAATALRSGADRSNGALTFVDNCAACHRTSGAGYDDTFPKLARSSVVNSDNAASLIRIVLLGSEMPSTQAAPTHYAMPGFAARLTDRDIADVLTFVRASWGNHAPAVKAADVAKARAAAHAAPPPRRAENE